MSNHNGSYLLNAIFQILNQYDFFSTMGKEKTQLFISEVLEYTTNQWDCNPYEILENIGEQLGICYSCVEYANNLEDGICEKCSSSF